ncbi:MAG: TIGR02281 family clan AA aspartic protease [Wenzhouxiangellaceae bacterium]
MNQATPDNAARFATWFWWLLVLVVLTAGFAWLMARQNNPNQQVVGRIDGGVAEVQLVQNRAGHYVATGEINNTEVVLMLDTGATSVAVPLSLAEQMNLPNLGPVTLETANGTARGYLTRLDEVRLGPIVRRDVSAVVSPGMDGDVLLGMSFLRELELVQRDRTLLLRQY